MKRGQREQHIGGTEIVRDAATRSNVVNDVRRAQQERELAELEKDSRPDGIGTVNAFAIDRRHYSQQPLADRIGPTIYGSVNLGFWWLMRVGHEMMDLSRLTP